jgi:hypothetical protein
MIFAAIIFGWILLFLLLPSLLRLLVLFPVKALVFYTRSVSDTRHGLSACP